MIWGYLNIIVAGLCLAAILFDQMYYKAPLLAMGCLILFAVFLGQGIALLTASAIGTVLKAKTEKD